MKLYRPNAWVRLGVPLVVVFVTVLLIGIPRQEFARGGDVAKYAMFSIAAIMLCLVVWAYFNTATVQLSVTPSALEVSWIFARRKVSWNAIHRIDWHNALHAISIKESSGVIAMFSTDGFPGWPELVAEIHGRSKCLLSGNLRTLLIAKGLLERPETEGDG